MKHRKQQWISLKLLFTILILIILVGCQSYAKDYEQIDQNEKIIIRFSHVVGEDTPKGQAARYFASLMKEKTKGKVEVQVFANGSLYRDGEEWDALQNGDIQMIAPAMAKLTDRIPELKIFDLPFFFDNMDQIHAFADGTVGNLIYQSAKKQNVIPLSIWDNGFKQFTNRDFPLRKATDFKGLTFRIMPSSVLDNQFAFLGANAEAINFNDVYQSLDKKQIDGQENTISNIYTKKFYKVQNYLTLSNHGYLGYLVIINQDFWNQLTPELQKTIKETIAEVTVWQREKSKELETYQLNLIKACDCIQIDTIEQKEIDRFKAIYSSIYKNLELELDPSFISEVKKVINK